MRSEDEKRTGTQADGSAALGGGRSTAVGAAKEPGV